MTTKNKFSENNFNATIGNTVLCDGFLIPMTDFVLSLGNQRASSKVENIVPDLLKINDYIFNYAKLLKKPLKLEMFVPCDEDGDILDEPEDYELRLTNMMTEYNDEVYRHKQAKEKVLFEGFELVRFIEKENPCYVVSNGENEVTFHIGLYNFSKGVRFANTIEDLIHIQPILTESAIKQI